MHIVKGKITWIDLVSPGKRDVEYLKNIHDFHPIILDEVMHASARSKAENYGTYLYLTYHFPLFDSKLRTSRRAEMDFLITKDTVITIRYEDFEAIHSFKRNLEANPVAKAQIMENGGYVVYYLLQEINDFCLRQLRHIEENVASVTRDLFIHKEYEMLRRISLVKRDILDYGVITRPQSLILHSLLETGTKFWGEDLRVYLSDLIGDNSKITQQLENYKDTVESCEETNAQLLNAKTNTVMQRFTILAFLTFPSMLFTSLFTVDAMAQKFSDPRYFFFGLATVFLGTLIAVFVFRKRGLLSD